MRCKCDCHYPMLPGAALVGGVTVTDTTDPAWLSVLHFVDIIHVVYVYATSEPGTHQLRHVMDLCSNAGLCQ